MEQREGLVETGKLRGRKQKEKRIMGYLKMIQDSDLDDLLWVTRQYACKAANNIVREKE